MIEIPCSRCFTMIQFDPQKPIELGREFLCDGCQIKRTSKLRNQKINKIIFSKEAILRKTYKNPLRFFV